MAVNIEKLKSVAASQEMAFHVAKLGVVRAGHRVHPSYEWHGVRSLEEAIANPVPRQYTHLPR